VMCVVGKVGEAAVHSRYQPHFPPVCCGALHCIVHCRTPVLAHVAKCVICYRLSIIRYPLSRRCCAVLCCSASHTVYLRTWVFSSSTDFTSSSFSFP
jgi:hypothetical protein